MKPPWHRLIGYPYQNNYRRLKYPRSRIHHQHSSSQGFIRHQVRNSPSPVAQRDSVELLKPCPVIRHRGIHLSQLEAKWTSRDIISDRLLRCLSCCVYRNDFIRIVHYLTTLPSSRLAMRHCRNLIRRSSCCPPNRTPRDWWRDTLTMQRRHIGFCIVQPLRD